MHLLFVFILLIFGVSTIKQWSLLFLLYDRVAIHCCHLQCLWNQRMDFNEPCRDSLVKCTPNWFLHHSNISSTSLGMEMTLLHQLCSMLYWVYINGLYTEKCERLAQNDVTLKKKCDGGGGSIWLDSQYRSFVL